jgi:hypothetical protein
MVETWLVKKSDRVCNLELILRTIISLLLLSPKIRLIIFSLIFYGSNITKIKMECKQLQRKFLPKIQRIYTLRLFLPTGCRNLFYTRSFKTRDAVKKGCRLKHGCGKNINKSAIRLTL